MKQSPKRRIGIITMTTAGGWKTVHKRWEKLFTTCDECEVRFYHIEDYALKIGSE